MLNFRNSKNLVNSDYIKYFPDIKFVSVAYWPERFVILDQADDGDIFEAQEHKNSVLIHFNPQFYHFLTDNLSPIIFEHKKDKDVHFIITIDRAEIINHYSYTRFLELFLNHHGISYDLVDLSKFKNVKIANFRMYNFANSQTFDDITENIREYLEDFIVKKDVIPHRKVYLSRTKVPRHDHKVLFGDDDPNTFMFQDDERIDDEIKLEQFMRDSGFEIIIPEEIPDFIDQINLINEVKTLVSLTGSGLMNMLFMQKKQTVIELTTPLVAVSRLTMHPFYYVSAYTSDILYTSIPHHRKVDDIIVKLNKFFGT